MFSIKCSLEMLPSLHAPPLTCLFAFMHLGFASNLQRSGPGPQFGPQQPGPPMSPHPSPGGPMHHSVGSYQQGGPGYVPQGGQYGPSGNTPSHLHLPFHSHHVLFFSSDFWFSYFVKKNFGWPFKNESRDKNACVRSRCLSEQDVEVIHHAVW